MLFLVHKLLNFWVPDPPTPHPAPFSKTLPGQPLSRPLSLLQRSDFRGCHGAGSGMRLNGDVSLCPNRLCPTTSSTANPVSPRSATYFFFGH